MTGGFLSAVVDTLFPGDDGAPPLPSATAAGVAEKLAEHLAGRDGGRYEVVLQAIAGTAEGEEEFVRADEARRITVVRRIEAHMRGPFRALVSCVLQDYYDAEPVQLAMGWRAGPPQPSGHVLPSFDRELLEPVKRRGRLWR